MVVTHPGPSRRFRRAAATLGLTPVHPGISSRHIFAACLYVCLYTCTALGLSGINLLPGEDFGGMEGVLLKDKELDVAVAYACTHARADAHIHTRIHTFVHTFARMCARTHARTRPHTHPHIRAHIHAHARTHAQVQHGARREPDGNRTESMESVGGHRPGLHTSLYLCLYRCA